MVTQCDGSRPSCARCQMRDLECVYKSVDESETPTMILKRENEALQTRSNTLEEIVDLLTYMPDDVAQDVLQRLRTTSDPASVLQSIDEDISGYLPSDHSTAPEISSSSNLALESELMEQHQRVYPGLDLPDGDTRSGNSSSGPANIPPADHPIDLDGYERDTLLDDLK